MPSRYIGSAAIGTFGYTASFNVYERELVLSIYDLTTFFGSGNLTVGGVCFKVVDEGGTTLLDYNWSSPQIPAPLSTASNGHYLGNSSYTLDLGTFGYNFIFQKYKITGAIKDVDGTIYDLEMPVKSVCIPKEFTDYGYVQACMDLRVDCANATLWVKDPTVYSYNNAEPITKVTDGTLYYPLGTIASVPFDYTPFSNDVVYTGTYRIACTVTATYDLGDDFYALIDYTTSQEYQITCEKRMMDLLCCLQEKIQEAQRHCGDSKGVVAQEKLNQAMWWWWMGFGKEYNGLDSSFEAKKVKDILNCSCGKGAIKHVQPNPSNPSIFNILLTGVGATNVTSSTAGNTKNYYIQSDVYEPTKGNPSDLGLTIGLDQSVANVTKYPITLNYAAIAAQIASVLKFNNGLAYDSGTGYIQQSGTLVKNTTIPLSTFYLQYTAAASLFKIIDTILTATFATIIFGDHASTRDDTATFAPVNFLYTDSAGKFYSSPLVVNNGLTKTTGGTFKLGGALLADTTLSGSFILMISAGKFVVGSTTPSDVRVKFVNVSTADLTTLQVYNTQPHNDSSSIIGINGLRALTGAANHSGGQVDAGVAGTLQVENTANINLIEGVAYSGVVGLMYGLTNFNSLVGTYSGLASAVLLTGSARFFGIAGLHVTTPQTPTTFTGTIDNLYGIKIDAFDAASIGGVVPTKVYALKTDGLTDIIQFANKLTFLGTIAGSTGNQTIDKPVGQLQIAALGQTVTLGNSYITATSLIFPSLVATNASDVALSVVISAQSSGSCTFKLSAACVGIVKINFQVIETA